jgi:hypothetical protein
MEPYSSRFNTTLPVGKELRFVDGGDPKGTCNEKELSTFEYTHEIHAYTIFTHI